MLTGSLLERLNACHELVLFRGFHVLASNGREGVNGAQTLIKRRVFRRFVNQVLNVLNGCPEDAAKRRDITWFWSFHVSARFAALFVRFCRFHRILSIYPGGV